MSVLKIILLRIGQYILSFIRSLRKIICCRRKKEAEYLLPMTIEHVTEIDQTQKTSIGESEFKLQWESWPSQNENASHLNYESPRSDLDNNSEVIQAGEKNEEDFFKDMVPQIRKQKKIFIKSSMKDGEQESGPSNRLALDPNRITLNPELGVIDDNPSNWENSEDSELYDPDALIREKKRAEQEKRRAEHQRRKQEKENRKLSKPESLSSRMLSLSESKDKHKYS